MPEPRNLLVLLCDQLQPHCMSLYGGTVPTPAFDSVARRGAVFDRFYCATPMCVPTRGSMMTGRWPHQHGAICNSDRRYATLKPGEELLTDRLLDAGYHVGYEGIWHISREPAEDRTGEYAHFASGRFPYVEQGEMLVALGRSPDEQRGPAVNHHDEGVEETRISVPVPATWTPGADSHPDAVRARAIAEFITEAPDDRPFAVWCSLAGPHPPLLVPEPWMSMFDAAAMQPSPGLGESTDDLPRAVRESPGMQAVAGWSWDRWAPAAAAYYGYVAFVDHCQGMVLDALERCGRLEDTVIIASTDHGEMLGAHNIYQKFVVYEPSARVPFIISAPGVEPGRRSQLACQVDIAPTVLELLGLRPMEDAWGESLAPILLDADTPSRPFTFSEYNGWGKGGYHVRCAISQRYKYVYDHEDSDQLFDLQTDPDELVNLAADRTCAGVLAEHQAALAEWMHDTNDFVGPRFAG